MQNRLNDVQPMEVNKTVMCSAYNDDRKGYETHCSCHQFYIESSVIDSYIIFIPIYLSFTGSLSSAKTTVAESMLCGKCRYRTIVKIVVFLLVVQLLYTFVYKKFEHYGISQNPIMDKYDKNSNM